MVPPPKMAYWLFPLLWLVLTAIALARTDAGAWHADPVPWWVVPPFAVALILVGPLILLSRKRIVIEGSTLVIEAGLNTRRQAIAALALDKARILDLDEHTGFKPMLGMFGGSLPGYQAGYYLLRNRARAFVLLTRRDKVLALPRHDGGFVLLSPQHPQALLEQLRAMATPATGR